MSDVYVISLQSLVEEALADEKVKNLSGNVKVIEDLFSEQNRSVLRKQFSGIFAFIGFHPRVDSGVTVYLNSGSLSSDSGPEILVLFALDVPASIPVELDDQSFKKWIEIGTDVLPSYTIIRNMFKDPVVLTFPGIIFFEHFIQLQNPVYIPLSNASSEESIGQQMRQLFAIAQKAYRLSSENDKGFLDIFAQNLQKNSITYERGRDVSVQEWLVNAFRIVSKHFGDIVSAIQLFKP